MRLLPLHLRKPSTVLLAGLMLISAAFAMSTATPTSAALINASVATYLDAHPQAGVSLIIEAEGDPAGLEQMVRDGGGHIDQQMFALGGFQATVSPQLADRLNHDPRVKRLNLNAPVRWLGSAVNSSNLANRYESLSRVSAAWNGGLDGSEVQVAVVDSGVFPHEDLTKASPYVPGNLGNRLLTINTNSLSTDALDHVGHGTHVAGVVGGNGYDSGGQYIGVAPNSLIVGVKVADQTGGANEGDVITGLEWIYQANQHGFKIKVVNLSLMSTVAQSYQASALDAMVEKLWKSGVTVVAASGNGSGGTVQYAPGNDPYIITVGSIDDYYQGTLAGSNMADWALYGTTQDGFAKPDVVADGSHVVSLNVPGSMLMAEHPTNIVGLQYFKMGGTSMASPQVAGMAALMLQNNPSLTPNKIKKLITGHTTSFSTHAYTSRLGTPGGYLDSSALGRVSPGLGDADDGDANAGVALSQSLDPVTNNLLFAGTSWPDPVFSTAPWTSVAWNSVAWNSVAWNSVAWNSVAWNSVAWNSVAWNSVAWNSVAWNSVAWNSVAWNSVAWNSVAWNSVAWNSVAWNSVAWNSVAWNDTSFS